jgi:hypothetical protein
MFFQNIITTLPDEEPLSDIELSGTLLMRYKGIRKVFSSFSLL